MKKEHLNEGSDRFKDLREQWLEEAKGVTIETLPGFITKLTEGYQHDYGTICHATAVAAIAAAWAVNNTPQGGITGFQAGEVMWKFIRGWVKSDNKTGMKLLDYDKLLYPQYWNHFDNRLDAGTWKLIQAEAENLLEADENNRYVHPDVLQHWKDIVEGRVPFGFVIEED